MTPYQRIRESIDFPLRDGVLLSAEDSRRLAAQPEKKAAIVNLLARRDNTPIGRHHRRVKREIARMFAPR